MAATSIRPKTTVSQDDLIRIGQIIDNHADTIKFKEKPPVVIRYFAGQHRTVFELSEFPGLIIKLDRSEQEGAQQMLASIEKCAGIVESRGLWRCVVPSVNLISTSQGLAWVEEKLDGVYNADDATEFSEMEFEKKDGIIATWILTPNNGPLFLVVCIKSSWC